MKLDVKFTGGAAYGVTLQSNSFLFDANMKDERLTEKPSVDLRAENYNISVKDSPSFDAEMGEVHTLDNPDYLYTGSYEVTPRVEAQSLPTKEKFLKEDVQIEAIPYFDVSNTAGGSTVYIGKL